MGDNNNKNNSRKEVGKPQLPPAEDGHKRESIVFLIVLFVFQIFLITIYALWVRYDTDVNDPYKSASNVALYYNYFRDVNIMIFFGFGFLMTFIRRYAYSALGYTLLISALVVQWAVPIRGFFHTIGQEDYSFDSGFKLEFVTLLDGLFCAGAVMITFGAVLGKTTPLQMVTIGIIEPMFYFLNTFLTAHKLHAFDIGGGMWIHTFGAFFGLGMSRWLTTEETKSSTAYICSYNSDLFSMAGTLFLWMMWPSFNAATAPEGDPQFRALVNTFLSIAASTTAAFLLSRLLGGHRFEMVHVQNSTLAGGVVQGVMAHLNITPAGAISSGFIAGLVSVFGFVFFTPWLAKKLSIQDVCGILNLHGIPGVIGSVGGILAALHAVRRPEIYGAEESQVLFPAGSDQPARQAIALAITLGIGIGGGILTGFLLKLIGKLNTYEYGDWFHDRRFWTIPSDYYQVTDHSSANQQSKELESIAVESRWEASSPSNHKNHNNSHSHARHHSTSSGSPISNGWV